MSPSLLVSGLLMLCIGISDAHVGLTYPPARKYDLDFLDTFRTIRPCGMGKGSLMTTIPNNGDITITWHLGYPHRGTFILELYDSNMKKLQNLTPGSDYVVTERTTQEYTVSLPADLTCSQCTIRLLRQALEWGKSYRFQSCADVDIVNSADYTEDCSGRGTYSGGSCTCSSAKYTGDKCQYENDCETAADCNGNGTCEDLGGTALPKKTCYCDPKYFGINCERESSKYTETSFDAAEYAEQKFGATTLFYWRLDGADHFEGVIAAKTDSYLAVGWRDLYDDKSCHDKFPKDAAKITGTDFHPMDCLDIVLGTVRNGKSRISDYYTRDRSTPRLDKQFWGGKDDLTDAIGWQTDGITYIKFRKTIKGSGGSDRKFYGNLHLAWAHGQDPTTNPFYRNGELKYHGPHKGFSELLVGPEPWKPRFKAMIAAIILLVIIFVFQMLHNFTRIKKD